MQLTSLQLVNFRNYAETKVEFPSKINVLVGKNGSGKTNLLDAIHYLSLTKSAFAATDAQAIRQGEKYFSIKGRFDLGGNTQEVFCFVQQGSKKIFREGPHEYAKLSEHIGKYPVVLIAPDDTDLVREGSEPRRRFFDTILSQIDSEYLQSLIQYTYALKQRNSLLKMFGETAKVDVIALESYDRILVKEGTSIFLKRQKLVSDFAPLVEKYYSFMAGEEHVGLYYQSELLKIPMEQGILQSRQRDILSQRTNFGIHRDDYLFTLTENDLKRMGSQGQIKSFTIALKLAQFDTLRDDKGNLPILLLDDIFDKLDDLRIGRLLELIRRDSFGQLFITDARPDRTRLLLEDIGIPAEVFDVNNGVIAGRS